MRRLSTTMPRNKKKQASKRAPAKNQSPLQTTQATKVLLATTATAASTNSLSPAKNPPSRKAVESRTGNAAMQTPLLDVLLRHPRWHFMNKYIDYTMIVDDLKFMDDDDFFIGSACDTFDVIRMRAFTKRLFFEIHEDIKPTILTLNMINEIRSFNSLYSSDTSEDGSESSGSGPRAKGPRYNGNWRPSE